MRLSFARWSALSLPLALLILTSTAHAQQTAAVMPAVGGHREIPSSVQEEARQAAIELLRTEDLVVLEARRVEGSLDATLASCAPGAACATVVRNTLGVDLLVGLVVWGSSERQSDPQSVGASILDATGTRYVGSATVQQGVPTAIRDALRSALRDQRRGPGPFLEVAGTRGAVCELDGAAVGSIPVTVRATPGEHELIVRLEGYEPQTLRVEIPDDPARTTEVTVELRPSGDGPPSAGASRPDVAANLLIAGGLAIAGIASAIDPMVTLAREGECVRPLADGFCGERVAFGARGGVLLGLGAALLVAGVVVAIAQPITVSAAVSPEGARLNVGGSF